MGKGTAIANNLASGLAAGLVPSIQGWQDAMRRQRLAEQEQAGRMQLLEREAALRQQATQAGWAREDAQRKAFMDAIAGYGQSGGGSPAAAGGWQGAGLGNPNGGWQGAGLGGPPGTTPAGPSSGMNEGMGGRIDPMAIARALGGYAGPEAALRFLAQGYGDQQSRLGAYDRSLVAERGAMNREVLGQNRTDRRLQFTEGQHTELGQSPLATAEIGQRGAAAAASRASAAKTGFELDRAREKDRLFPHLDELTKIASLMPEESPLRTASEAWTKAVSKGDETSAKLHAEQFQKAVQGEQQRIAMELEAALSRGDAEAADALQAQIAGLDEATKLTHPLLDWLPGYESPVEITPQGALLGASAPSPRLEFVSQGLEAGRRARQPASKEPEPEKDPLGEGGGPEVPKERTSIPPPRPTPRTIEALADKRRGTMFSEDALRMQAEMVARRMGRPESEIPDFVEAYVKRIRGERR